MGERRQLALAVWQDGDCSVVELRGELDLHTSAELREALVALLSAGRHEILIDLRDLTFIDSAGLGVLIGGLRRARADGGDVVLAAPGPSVGRVLDISGLSNVFEVRPAAPDRLGG